MKVISHSADADGILSAYLVARKFNLVSEDDFIMTDYGKHTDFLSKISPGEKVVICDFGLENKVEDMNKLLEITKDVVWIDHHESTIKEYGEFGETIPGLRSVGTAACMLTYIYFYIFEDYYYYKKGKITLEEYQCQAFYNEAPQLVILVHDYDVWKFKYEHTEAFKLGLDIQNITSPLDRRWDDLYEDENYIKNIIEQGKYVISYRNSIGKRACNNYGFECEINGKKGFALNNVFGGSPWFGDKIKEYDFVCSFFYIAESKQWEYSFYSVKEDVSCYELAKSVDSKGGGHKGAAGCVTDKFIF